MGCYLQESLLLGQPLPLRLPLLDHRLGEVFGLVEVHLDAAGPGSRALPVLVANFHALQSIHGFHKADIFL